MARQAGFFDTDERLRALSAAGDPLDRLAAAVNFELFRPELETALGRGDRSRGGRPPFDAVLMDWHYTRDATSGAEGPALVSQIRLRNRLVPTLVLTGCCGLALAVDAMLPGRIGFCAAAMEFTEALCVKPD